MESVRSGFGRNVDDAARGAAILSREIARNDPELLDSVERNALSDCRNERIDILAAVQEDIGAGRALAVDRKTGAPHHSLILDCIARQSNQVIRIAGKGGQVGNLL